MITTKNLYDNTIVNSTDANGNTMTQTGSFTKTDGSTGQTSSFLFSRDTTFTTATEWLWKQQISQRWQTCRGTDVYTLHQAMLRDSSGTLKGLVESFTSTTDETTRKALMEQILFTWTGSDTINSTSRGTQIDARKLHTLEMMYGTAFWGMRIRKKRVAGLVGKFHSEHADGYHDENWDRGWA